MRHDLKMRSFGMTKIVGIVASFSSLLLLTACMTPSQKYGVSKSTGTYFAVPNSWHEISQGELTKVESASSDATVQERLSLLRWADAFSPSSKITAQQVLSGNTPPAPIAFAQVRYLSGTEINAASYNSLRDLVLPITSWANGGSSVPSDFSIIDDGEVVQKAASGIHTRISFSGNDKISQIFDQTSLLSTDRRSIHVLIVRCSSSCFTKNSETLDKVIKSFTVRGAQ